MKCEIWSVKCEVRVMNVRHCVLTVSLFHSWNTFNPRLVWKELLWYCLTPQPVALYHCSRSNILTKAQLTQAVHLKDSRLECWSGQVRTDWQIETDLVLGVASSGFINYLLMLRISTFLRWNILILFFLFRIAYKAYKVITFGKLIYCTEKQLIFLFCN